MDPRYGPYIPRVFAIIVLILAILMAVGVFPMTAVTVGVMLALLAVGMLP